MTRAPTRIASIDGLRGLLAAYVMIWHFVEHRSAYRYLPNGSLAVGLFFIMSAYVLTPAWTGDYPAFLLRRFLRLWPVYAACLTAGALILGVKLTWADFAFYPLTPSPAVWIVDTPIWSLHVEAWAMLAMPFIVWCGKTLPRVVIGTLTFALLSRVNLMLGYGALFVLGSYLTRYPFNAAALNWRVPQWLGKISYSLYLTHWIVFAACDAYLPNIGRFVALPLAIVVGYLVWRVVERRSILLSREVPKFIKQKVAGYGDYHQSEGACPSP